MTRDESETAGQTSTGLVINDSKVELASTETGGPHHVGGMGNFGHVHM